MKEFESEQIKGTEKMTNRKQCLIAVCSRDTEMPRNSRRGI